MKNTVWAIAALIGFAVYSSAFVIYEGQRGIVVQFGKVNRDSAGETRVYEPGLHFKIPVLNQVRRLDARIQTLDEKEDRFVTLEKKDLIIDSYVKWRINDFSKYFLITGGDSLKAEGLLKRKINNGLRTEIGKRTISEIVTGKAKNAPSVSDLPNGRNAVENAMKDLAAASELGIQVLDVRIKKINLPQEVSSSIYQRMRAERNAVAKEHRSKGMEQSEILRADMDRKVTVMLADAERHARTLRGEGDATAAKLYADTYRQDPAFFGFLRSMEAYTASLATGNDVMVLKPDSEFFRYLKRPSGKVSP